MHFPIDPEDFTNTINCSAWVATAIVGAAAVGGAAKAYSANLAADAQKSGAANASATLKEGALKGQAALDYYNTVGQSYLDPYRKLGQSGIEELTSRLPDLTKALPVSQEQLDLQKPLTLNQEELEKLPGYQFTKTQGLKAVQNSAAARGLGVSGAALKGAATFATGLADKTYLDQFAAEQANRQGAFGRYQQVWQDTLQGNQTAYDRLMGVIGQGEDASKYSGILSQKTGQGVADTLTKAAGGVASNTIGAANADAAAINATGGAISDAANTVGGYAAYKGLYGGAGAPNMSFVKGTAGDQFVPTFGK